MGRKASFGSVLGKHSDVEVKLTHSILQKVTDDQEFIDKIIDLSCNIGYNPLEHLPQDDLKKM